MGGTAAPCKSLNCHCRVSVAGVKRRKRCCTQPALPGLSQTRQCALSVHGSGLLVSKLSTEFTTLQNDTLLCMETWNKQGFFLSILYLSCVLDLSTFRNSPSPEQDLPPAALLVSLGFTTILVWMSCYFLTDLFSANILVCIKHSFSFSSFECLCTIKSLASLLIHRRF